MTHSTKMIMARIGFFVGWMILPLFAYAQVTCLSMGAFTDCSGPGIDQTQVQFSKQNGVIITDHTTMPYTFLNTQPAPAFNPAPLPTLTQPQIPTTSQMYQQLIAPTPGATGNSYYGIMPGQ